MSTFDYAFRIVIGNEGGYSNDPVDAGGETKYGISKKSYPHLDIKNLTIEQAKKIYKENYWDKCKCDEIMNQNIATQLFDTAINCGNSMAIKILQRAINVTSKVKTIEDGIIGPKTIAAIKVSDIKTLNNNMVAKRNEYYAAIVRSKPTQTKFLKGWTNRANRFLM